MGIASYNRGNKAVSEQFKRDCRPAEFERMDKLNSLPKNSDSGQPFGDIHFSRDHRGYWWATCPKTGFGYWYKTLHEAIKSWNVHVHTYDNGTWVASPITTGHVRYNNTSLIKRIVTNK